MNEFENMVFLVLFDILFIIVILKYLNLVELISLLFIGRDKVMIVLLLICFYVKYIYVFWDKLFDW